MNKLIDYRVPCLRLIVLLLVNGGSSISLVLRSNNTALLPVKGDKIDKINITLEMLKQMMWKRCSTNSYSSCAKLALVHVIEKLDSAEESYPLLPGISLRKQTILTTDNHRNDIAPLGQDFSDALDKYLVTKIKRYLESLTLNVKLLDRNTIEEIRSFEEITPSKEFSPEVQEGRGRKKQMNAFLMAGWMSGATLLALTMKTIAILSGKAVLAALLSLMLSLITSFGKGSGDSKTTTYEIITKPIVSHSHSTDVHEVHAQPEHNVGLAYRRSINFDDYQSNDYRSTRLPDAKQAAVDDLPRNDIHEELIYPAKSSMPHSERTPVYIHPGQYYESI